MNTLTRKETADRSKIHVANANEVKCWAHKLWISMDELRIIVEKVGNSAAAVRKELAMEAGDDASHR
jgi:3-oxoacyl-[acyl-carrier-protein] synthase III